MRNLDARVLRELVTPYLETGMSLVYLEALAQDAARVGADVALREERVLCAAFLDGFGQHEAAALVRQRGTP